MTMFTDILPMLELNDTVRNIVCMYCTLNRLYLTKARHCVC